MTKFQVAPPFGKKNFEQLKESISKHGVIVPVEYDREGSIIDGHHRVKACNELGITKWPRKERAYKSDEQRLEIALNLNAVRRHLSRSEKNAMIKAAVSANPQVSDNSIAKSVGVHNETVANARRKLEKAGGVTESVTRTDSSGRQQPARKPKRPRSAVVAATASPLTQPKKPQELEVWVRQIKEQINNAVLELNEHEQAALFKHLRQNIDDLECKLAAQWGRNSAAPINNLEFPDLPAFLDRRGGAA